MPTSTLSLTRRPLRGLFAPILALVTLACAAGDAPPSAASRTATSTATAGASTDITYIQPDGPPANPFSPAVRVGNLVFVSGTLGTRPDGTLVPGGIEAETRQVLENIKAVLASDGLGMDRIVRCTAYLADLAEWPAMNAVYRSYFADGKYPARAAVQATLLFGARVELECVAAAK
ncbi:MAG: RidA family protein [Gemmatimonadaceae bacterium]|nr:RidA family protein [Gemmatimonadaceae bacterium]